MDIEVMLGPIVLAVSFNSILFGTCVIQYYNYWTARFEDSWIIKSLVSGVMVLDIFQAIVSILMLWDTTVKNFNNPDIFANPPWSVSATSICIDLAAVPVQLFLGYRIKVLSRRWSWFILVAFMSLAQTAVGLAGSIVAISLNSPNNFHYLKPIADTWNTCAIVTDVIITALLFYYLRKNKTGFYRTDSVLQDLIRLAIETASLGAACCVADVIVFNVRSKTNLYFIFTLLQGRIYTNTLFLTLNSRVGFRQAMIDNKAHDYTPQGLQVLSFAERNHVEVNILNVPQDVQTDVVDFQPRPESRTESVQDWNAEKNVRFMVIQPPHPFSS